MNNENEYEHIDTLVLEYQSGNKEAAEKLIMLFQPFLLKYFNLLTGNGNFTDYECKQFLSLFLDDDETRRAFLSNKATQEQKSIIYRIINSIIYACSYFEQDELLNELVITFLALAKRYKSKGKGFTAYLSSTYRYELARRIKEIIQDPIIFQRDNILSFSDLLYADPDTISDDDIINRVDNFIILDDSGNEFDNTWIRGISCEFEGFAKLTAIERLILKYYYIDDLTDKQIAQRLGYHPDTIRKKRNEAVEILKSELMRYDHCQNGEDQENNEDNYLQNM